MNGRWGEQGTMWGGRSLDQRQKDFLSYILHYLVRTYFSSGITSRCQVCLRIYKFEVDDFTTSSQVVDQLERQGKGKKEFGMKRMQK